MNHHLDRVVLKSPLVYTVHLLVIIVKLRDFQRCLKGWIFIPFSLLKYLELFIVLHILFLLIQVLRPSWVYKFTIIWVARRVVKRRWEVIAVVDIIQISVIAHFSIIYFRILVGLAGCVIISHFVHHLAFGWRDLKIRCFRVFHFVLAWFDTNQHGFLNSFFWYSVHLTFLTYYLFQITHFLQFLTRIDLLGLAHVYFLFALFLGVDDLRLDHLIVHHFISMY